MTEQHTEATNVTDITEVIANMRHTVPAPIVTDYMQAKQTIYTGGEPVSAAVSVDLGDLIIELQLERVFGTADCFHFDVPDAYRLGRALVEAAERLSGFCAHGSYGEDTDPRHLLPAGS